MNSTPDKPEQCPHEMIKLKIGDGVGTCMECGKEGVAPTPQPAEGELEATFSLDTVLEGLLDDYFEARSISEDDQRTVAQGTLEMVRAHEAILTLITAREAAQAKLAEERFERANETKYDESASIEYKNGWIEHRTTARIGWYKGKN